MSVEEINITIDDATVVSGLWTRPQSALACLVLAHGAGAGMRHPSMQALADGLAARDVATLRYQFPYMERGSKRPDPPAVAQEAVRAAVFAAAHRAGDLPLFAGGRSFGGRMTSQAQAVAPLAGVLGLVFFAFPLHPAGKPATGRADHLGDVLIPLLFVQGDRDALAAMDLLQPVIRSLPGRATLVLAEQADHAFRVPLSSGKRDADLLSDIMDTTAAWMERIASDQPRRLPL